MSRPYCQKRIEERIAALPDRAVHKFLVGLGKLGDDAAEHHEDAPAVDLAVVLGEVVLIDLD